YVLIFDSCFIKVCHLETGLLVQIILGNDLRTWDERGIISLNALSLSAQTMSLSVSEPDGRDEYLNQNAQVHTVMNTTVMNAPEAADRPRAGVIIQQLVELLSVHDPGTSKD
ncbi:hypothetical protein BT96DRAFT_842379, partial [Gymnopus androsaceus JB14]